MVRLSAWHALAVLVAISEVAALSAHSPTDLFAHPQFKVVLKDEVLTNESVSQQLSKPRSKADPSLHLFNTQNGQAFLCSVPKVSPAPEVEPEQQPKLSEAEEAAEAERGLAHGLALLAPMSGNCLFLRPGGGWFTYSFCYGQSIRQFHALGMANSEPIEDAHHQSFVLGNAPTPVAISSAKAEDPRDSSLVRAAKAEKRIPATLGGGGVKTGLGINEGGKYISQVWEDGSVCDMTGLKRRTEVQFHCSTQNIDRIVIIRETAICVYSVVIHTPRLCSDAVFLDTSDRSSAPANEIECRPIVNPNGAGKAPSLSPSNAGTTIPAPKPIPAAAPAPAQDTPQAAPPAAAAPPVPPQSPFDHDPLADGVVRTEDGWYDEPYDQEMVTVIYDHETGAIQKAFTDDGEDITHEFDGYGPIEPGQEGAQQAGEAVAGEIDVEQLEQMAKALQQQIAHALRPHEGVAHGAGPATAAALGDRRTTAGAEQPPLEPAHAQDKSEHSKLSQAFQKKYDAQADKDSNDSPRRDEL